jgi:hypothetical protein
MSSRHLFFPNHTMPLTSTTRRQRRADRLASWGCIVMRACSGCVSRCVVCVVSPEVDACVECFKFNRRCSLAPNDSEIQKQFVAKEKLDNEIKETEAKAARLRKQRRLVLKRLRDLGDRESQNILELEADELRAALQDLQEDTPLEETTGLSPGAFSDLGPFLAQERLDLFDETLQPVVENSQRSQ